MSDPITFMLTLGSLLAMVAATGVCFLLLSQNRPSGWVVVLTLAHVLMLTRRLYLVWMQLLYSQPTDRVNELTSLLVGICFFISWSLLYQRLAWGSSHGGKTPGFWAARIEHWLGWLRLPSNWSARRARLALAGQPPHVSVADSSGGLAAGGAGESLRRYALMLNVLALATTLGIAAYAWLISQQAVQDHFYQAHQAIADRMVQELDRSPATAFQNRQALLEHLTALWHRKNPIHSDPGLCVIGSDGYFWLWSNQPQRVGQKAVLQQLDPPVPARTVQELIDRRAHWAGQWQGGGGDVLALAYSHRLEALVGVHVRGSVLRQELWQTVLPWFSGFVLVGLILFPFAGMLMYRAYQAAHRQLVQTNRTLAESEGRFRELIDHIDEVFWLVNPATRQVLYISPAFQRIMDYVPGPCPRPLENILPQIHPADRQQTLAAIALWTQGQYPSLEIRAMRPDGTIRWTRTTVYPVRNDQSQVRHLVGMTRDITQWRRTEEALRESESRFRQLADHLEDVFWLLDLIGPRLIYVSPAAQGMFGHAPVQFMRQPRTFLEAVHREDRSLFLRRGHLHHPMRKAIEFRIVRPDGSIRWLRSRAFPVRDEAGRTYRLAGITQDITAYKLNQQALQEQTQRNRLVIQTAMDGFCVLSQQVKILEVNPAFCQMVGYGQSELLAMHISQLDVDYDTPEIQRHKQQAYEQGTARFETRFRHRDGHLLLVEISARRVMLHQQLRLFVFIRDISAYKLAQEHYRQAAESNRRLLNEVNHRVRNNLASLLSLISLTQGKTRDADQFAAAIEHRIGAMAQVHNLLVDSGWSDLDLRQMIGDMANWMQASLAHVVPVEVDGPQLTINPRQAMPLAMTFQELFTNSIKYGAHRQPGGRVLIGWQVQELADGRRSVTLCWQEQGGPPIRQTNRASLGSELIDGFMRFELGGRCELRFPVQGADHQLIFILEPAT